MRVARIDHTRRQVESVDDRVVVAGSVVGAETHATSGKRCPDVEGVFASGQHDIGLQDRIASFEKGWVAGCELHCVQNDLDQKVVAAVSGIEVGVVAVVIDEIPVQIPRKF